jgi:hypothetical protein
MASSAVPTMPVGVPETPQTPQVVAPQAVPQAEVSGTASPQSVPEQGTTPPVNMDEREAQIRAKYEQDVARVKSAEQRRAAELQRQLMAERQARIQLEQQQVQRAMQGMTPEERNAFQQRLQQQQQEQQLQQRAAQIEQAEASLKQRAVVEAAKTYKAELITYYGKYFGVPETSLDQTSPDAMHKSALIFLQNKAQHASSVATTPPPTQVTTSTGGAVSPGGLVSQISSMSWAERQKFYAQHKQNK